MDEDRNYGRDNNWDNLGYRGTGSGYDNERNARSQRDAASDYRSRGRDFSRDDNRRAYGGSGSFYGSNREDYGARGGFNADRGFGGGQGGGYDEWSRRGERSFGDRHSGGSRYGGMGGDRGSGRPSDYYEGWDMGNHRSNFDRDRQYGGQSASNQWSSGQSYGGGERGFSQGGRGFWDKASDEVSSWFGDSDAERRRDQDQHRGRGPKNYSRSDDRIRDDVNDRLTDDGWLDASNIEVSVKDREVTLSGTVNDRNGKRRAEDVAEGVSGVSHVQNNLRVKSSEATGTDVDVDRTGGMVAKSVAGGQR